MVNLWMAVGVPGSGKSTYIKNKIKKYGGIRISRDDIRFSLLNDTDSYFDKENEVFAEFIKQIQNAINSKIENIYVDATHLTEKSRNKVLNKLSLQNVQIHILYFDIPLYECIERNANREGRAYVPITVINNMYETLMRPNFWEKYEYVSIITIDLKGKETIQTTLQNDKINTEIENIFIKKGNDK